MGVFEISPSSENYREIKNPISLNKNINSNKDSKLNLNFNLIQNDFKKMNINDFINKNTKSNENLITNEMANKFEIKSRIFNPISYIHNSKTNYSNYKRVPHLKSPTNNLMPSDNKINNNNNVSEENNSLWFKTQYRKFNKISDNKDTKEFSINEYYRKNHKILENNINIINENNKNDKLNLYNRNKPQVYNNKSKNKSSIVYTKALPIDYNSEKKLENLLFIDNKSFNNENLLYIIEKKDFLKIDEKNYSTKKEYKNIIKKYSNNKYLLSKYLLDLKERNWYKELVDISNLLMKKRSENEILINDKYLRKIIKLQEQFKWIIESLGIYFNNVIFGKENDINYVNTYNLPTKEKIKWFSGFKWKGIYIKVLPNEKSKALISEIKSLNYFYFEYLQLLENYPYIQINQLLYHIIFPIIAYTTINGFILFGSAIININEFCEEKNNLSSISEFISLNDIIKYNNGYINIDFDRINVKINKDLNNKKNSIFDIENKYYIKDLLNSKLFSELSLYHFIRIYREQFLLFNLVEFIPKLFEIKLDNEYKINYLTVINNKRVYYNSKFKNNINNINNKKSNEIKSNNLQSKIFSNPKEVLMNFFKINPSSHLKSKDITINNIFFRIIYEAQTIKDDNCKNKQFVDYLFNYNKMVTESCIVEPYAILYDLKDPIKLKYSLIKSFFNIENNKANKNRSLNIILNKLFYISTNYISFFNSWCEMLNKNSFNIKTYSDLKENMNKYGISSQLRFFALININNSEISDIIKISLLVKAIKFIFNKNDNKNILYKLNNIKINNINELNKFSEYRKTKLLYIIKSILYPNEIINQSKEYFNNLFKELVFYVNVIFLKLKLIDGYLSLGLLNIHKNNINMNINSISKKITGFESAKDFLKNIIKISRNKPFLFLTEMEYKLNFIIDPFIKFKSSISIESMSNKLELKHIILNKNKKTHSYINSSEISGLILAKLIYLTNKKNLNNNYNINTGRKICYSKANSLENVNNINIALRPNYMKTNINLNSFKSSIKNNNSNLNSPVIGSDLDSNKTSKDNFVHIKNGKTTEFYLLTSDKNESQNFESTQRTKILEKEVCDNFILEMPSICYKMNYLFEKYKNKITETFSKYLKNIYPLPELKIIKKWKDSIYKIFYGILSSNGEIEHSLFKSLVYLFIITFFCEKNFNEANLINAEIKDIFKKGNYQLSLVDLSIINLFQALSSEKYIESETPYSKCLMLLLMNYGEPRGRNNDSHGILEFPIWKIARKTRLEQKGINDYFKEMCQSLSFFESKKSTLNFSNIKTIFNYSNNVYNNIENIKIINKILKNFKINNINYENYNNDFENMSNESTITEFLNNNISENPGVDFFSNLNKITNNIDLTLNQNIFDDKLLNKIIIKYFNFPPVSSNVEKLDKIFFKSEFIIFILKQIQSLFIGKKMIINEEYINEYISDEIFNPYPFNYKHKISYNTNESDTNDEYPLEENLNNKKINNCSICMHKEKLEKNDYYVFPKNSNYIYNFIEDKRNQTVKNKKTINEKLSELKDKRATMADYNINKENMKNKNKSVEGIKKRKTNLFSHFLYQEILQKLSYKLNIQSGIAISFGNNSHNETSHDNYDKITRPKTIFKLKNLRIEKIYSGWEHNIFITDKGEIYSFGNNQFYQCGLPNKDNIAKIIKDPTNISIFNNNIKGISAACGNEHSLILSNTNEVYAFGNNEDGALGINDNKIKRYQFTKINFGKYTNKIKVISAGTIHNLALTNDNKLFSWGSSQGGQLGLPENYLLSQHGYKDSFFLSNPCLVQVPRGDKKYEEFIKIGCGEAHSVALTNSGKVYSWGFGSNGQLGLGFCEDSFEPGTGLFQSRKFTPELITYLEDEKIVDIKCGKTFTMFINNKNELYACGVNDLNQLGINETSSKEHLINKEITCYDFVFPTKVDCFLNMKILKIACGEGHCLAIIKDLITNIKTIWSWGNNKFGQLGQGSLMKKTTPNPINYLSEYSSKKFENISCGGFHSLCLIKYNENLKWIEDDYNEIIKTIDEVEII